MLRRERKKMWVARRQKEIEKGDDEIKEKSRL